MNHVDKMTPNERLSISIRSVVLLKCLKASGFFSLSDEEKVNEETKQEMKRETRLSENESYIAWLLFHFQTGIQYNLHAIYQVILLKYRYFLQTLLKICVSFFQSRLLVLFFVDLLD